MDLSTCDVWIANECRADERPNKKEKLCQEEKRIDTFYLIDYENVNSSGLIGCEKLEETDHIIIFFTKNAMKINMSEIADHGEAELRMMEIPAGKQSTDIHIGSYLGYLAGLNKEKECSVVIVSKDTDFDNIIKFWNSKSWIHASRASQIKEPDSKLQNAKRGRQPRKTVAKHDEKQKLKQNVNQEIQNDTIPAEKDTEIINDADSNDEIMQILSKAGFKSKIAAYVASTVGKNKEEKKGKQQIYRAIISKYGQSDGLNIYNHIRKYI